MKYGDYDNVKKDARTLMEILGRQGNSLLLEVIAEHVGQSALAFSMSQIEVDRVKKSLTDELNELINERT